MLGSSPRVWGQVSDKPPSVCTKRIIPTRVGTRGDRENGSTRYEDHPHACGDKGSGLHRRNGCPGSSPRVWGQVALAEWKNGELGIIPTRVGTSLQSASYRASSWDHPHACGDKETNYGERLAIGGSSPRVWGQVSVLWEVTSTTGGSSPRVWGQDKKTCL